MIFPTFLRESRATFGRLKTFANDTRPLVRDLQPVMTELRPTLRDVGGLAPDLENLFRDLGPLIDEAPDTLPSAARFIRGAEPVFAALSPYLREFNPILSYLNFQQEQVADFITNGGGSFSSVLPPLNASEGPRHYLRCLQREQRPQRRHLAHPAQLRPRQRLPGPELLPPRPPARHVRGLRLQAGRRAARARQRRAALLRPAQVAVGRRRLPAPRVAARPRCGSRRRATTDRLPPRLDRWSSRDVERPK